MNKSKFSFILTALTIVFGFAPCKAELSVNDADSTYKPISRELLFTNGDMGSQYWRIPALATTNSGVVIAAADKRNDSNMDLPNLIDVVIRRSTDSGQTWGPMQMVLKSDSIIGGFGDAALGVHRPSGELVLVAAHGRGLWDSTPENRQLVVVTHSKDDGLTWSEPIDITDQLFNPNDGVAPVKAYAGFASSGTLLCDDNGRLWFILVARENERNWGPLSCFVCYSDDGGYNWNINPVSIDEKGDEAKIAQLSDGSYLASIRNSSRGERRFTRSTDGVTWTPVELQKDLIDPACNGDLISLTPAEIERVGIQDMVDENGLLLHSIANDPQLRRNVSIFSSKDKGESWEKEFVVTPLGSAYSALTILPDGTLGCLSEEDSTEGGYSLWFTKIDLKECLSE